MVALLFVGQGLVAQSFGTNIPTSSQSTSKDTPSLENADFVSAGQAVENLLTQATVYRDAQPTAGTQEADNSFRIEYFRYIGMQVLSTNDIYTAMAESGAFLENTSKRYASSALTLSTYDVFQEALDLVTN